MRKVVLAAVALVVGSALFVGGSSSGAGPGMAS